MGGVDEGPPADDDEDAPAPNSDKSSPPKLASKTPPRLGMLLLLLLEAAFVLLAVALGIVPGQIDEYQRQGWHAILPQRTQSHCCWRLKLNRRRVGGWSWLFFDDLFDEKSETFKSLPTCYVLALADQMSGGQRTDQTSSCLLFRPSPVSSSEKRHIVSVCAVSSTRGSCALLSLP